MTKKKTRGRLSAITAIITGLALSAAAQTSRAQAPNVPIPDHKSMMNPIWETIDLLMYKIDEVQGKTVYTPYFPPPLKNLDGKSVELSGYMVPISSERTHDRFMLATLPVFQCMFCGQNGIPPMVEIELQDKKIKFTDKPISVKGKVKLNSEFTGQSEIQLLNAQVEDLKKAR